MLWKIALRNIFRQRRRTLLTILTMLGGFVLASISIGVSEGSYNEIIDRFTRSRLGHVQIVREGFRDDRSIYENISAWEELVKKLESRPDVAHAVPHIYGGGLATVHESATPVTVTAIDPAREEQAFSLSRRITKGAMISAEGAEVLVGKELAAILEARVGDTLYLFSQTARGRTAEDIFIIRGLVKESTAEMGRMSLYMPIQTAQEYYELSDRVHEIALVSPQKGASRQLAKDVAAAINADTLAVEPWQVFQKSFYTAMQADKQGAWVSLAVILVIVAFGILNTVLMAVLERQREYGLMKAIGTTPGQIFLLIILEMGILSLISISVGIPLALGGNWYLAEKGISMGQSFTYGGMEFSHIYGEINCISFVIPAVVVVTATLFVSIFPAIKAAKTDPAVTMRTE
ncbi:MAG: ABC transporter permease [Fibrobacterota bacterium]